MWLDLAPHGEDRKSLSQALNSYLRDPVDYDIDVNIAQDKIPHWKMGERQSLGRGLWLGKTQNDGQVSWQGRFKGKRMQTSRPEGLIPIDTIPNSPRRS
jgi:predicted component of type VI protein secretion system